MVDLESLNDKVRESGLSLTEISIKAGIPIATLSNRLRGKGEFHASEIAALADVLNMAMDDRKEIFLR